MNHRYQFNLWMLFLLTTISAVLFSFGCRPKPATNVTSDQLNATPEYQFALTTEPQRALFLTEKGWTGGGGDPVYVPGIGYRARLHGRMIVLTSPAQQLIDEKAGPPDRKGQRKILVEADVHLEATSSHGNSIYSVIIDDLVSAQWR